MQTRILYSLIFAMTFAAYTGVPEASAQILQDEVPFNARGVGIDDRVGDFVPLDLIFEDESGTKVGLGKYFNQGRPVVLTLNYSDCPGLCIAQLDNLVSTLRELNGGGIGEEFDIVTVSIDPSETPEKASRTKAKYTGLLRGSQAEDGWHFLTGKRREIAALAEAVGFRYLYDKANARYNHPAATYFLSDKGRICRCLVSLGVEPDQFKLALGEASRGKLSFNVADTIVQLCYLYDPEANRYTAGARRIMAFGGAAFVMLLTGVTAPFWFSKRRGSNPETELSSESEGNVSDGSAADGHARSAGGDSKATSSYN